MALEKLSEEEMSHIKGGDGHWEIINDQCKDCFYFQFAVVGVVGINIRIRLKAETSECALNSRINTT